MAEAECAEDRPAPSRIDAGTALDLNPAFLNVRAYAPGLLDTKIAVDGATLQHELGVGQLAAQMLPPALRDRRFDLADADEDYAVVASVSGGLHDTGKYRPDIQAQLSKGDFGPEVREWVREQHCREGARQIGHYQRAGLVPAERLPVLGIARFVAARHHSPVPDAYHRLPRAQAIAWGLTHLVQYCDAVHALWFDHSIRRDYQKEREGQLTRTMPPGAILGLIHRVCGQRRPIIDGVEITIEAELRYYLMP